MSQYIYAFKYFPITYLTCYIFTCTFKTSAPCLRSHSCMGTADLAKGHNRIEKYFVSEYPLSKLVQTVIQSQSCFSIVVLGRRKNLAGVANAYVYLTAMCPICNKKVSYQKQIALQHFRNGKIGNSWGMTDSVTEQNATQKRCLNYKKDA